MPGWVEMISIARRGSAVSIVIASALAPCVSAKSADGVASASMRHLAMMMARVQTASTSSRMWVERMMAL